MNVQRFIIWINLVVVSHTAFSQSVTGNEIDQSEKEKVSTADYSDFNIIFHQDLENTPVGTYNLTQWNIDWNDPSGGKGGAQRTIITDYNSGGRISRGMKWTFPENTFSVTPDYGYLWHTPIGVSLEECFLSFSIMFKPGFTAVLAGKIPGVQGGIAPKAGKPPPWDGGFGGSLIFKHSNKGEPDNPPMPAFYIYHQDQEIAYGDSPRWNGYTFDVSTDIWYDITYRIVMNTATATEIGGPDGLRDGIMEGFINGELWGQKLELRLRNLLGIGTDVIRVQGFFGGGDESFATARDEWMLVDNFYVWTYSDEYLRNNPSVKRGRQANKLKSIIYTPFDVLFGDEPPNPDPDPDPEPDPDPDPDPDPEPDPPDVKPPTVPSGLLALDSTQNSITFTWNSATDNIGVQGYKVYVDEEILGATGGTTYNVTTLSPATRYALAVSAFDAESNESPKSSAIIAYTRTKDTLAPTVPANLTIHMITSHSLEVSWDASQDDVGIDRYEVYLEGDPKISTDETYVTISRLDPSTTYAIAVRAYDAAENMSALSDEVSATTSAPDNEAPTTPTGLMETGNTETTIDLVWEPSSDNVAVREYKIYVNQVEWERSTQTNETIARLQPGIEYIISVSAVDEAGNEGSKSATIKVTTKNNDITTQPRLPEISITKVYDNTITPSSVSKVGSLGFAKLENFGLEITEPENPDTESLIMFSVNQTEVVNENRILSDGLLALYTFSEGEGDIVEDISGISPKMDLSIQRQGLTTEWLLGQGLRVTDNTTISSLAQPGRLIDALSATNEITLEAWVKQEEIDQSGPARIVTLSSSTSSRAVTLAHKGNAAYYNYVSRLTTTETDENGNPELRTAQDFISSSLHHVVYTRNNLGMEKIYVNGLEMASDKRGGDFSSWDNDNKFALANEITGDRPWKGIYYLVAIYNEALNLEEVQQNYEAGFGQVQFVTELDTLESNVSYRLKPFVITDQGLIYGNEKDFLYENVTLTDSLFSFYPNPNNGNVILTIKNRDENVKTSYLRLADFAGQVHFTREIDLSEGLLEHTIELQLPYALKNGLYSLILIAGSRAYAEKFILMR